MQYQMNRIVAQYRQKCEAMQEKFTEKLEQVHTAYQKMAKRCQMMEQEIETLSKDKQELQEKFAEKSRYFHSGYIFCGLWFHFGAYYFIITNCSFTRQKRKLDEMYDQLRSEYESAKRSAIQPANNFYSRNEPDLFSNPSNMMDNRESARKGNPSLSKVMEDIVSTDIMSTWDVFYNILTALSYENKGVKK